MSLIHSFINIHKFRLVCTKLYVELRVGVSQTQSRLLSVDIHVSVAVRRIHTRAAQACRQNKHPLVPITLGMKGVFVKLS